MQPGPHQAITATRVPHAPFFRPRSNTAGLALLAANSSGEDESDGDSTNADDSSSSSSSDDEPVAARILDYRALMQPPMRGPGASRTRVRSLCGPADPQLKLSLTVLRIRHALRSPSVLAPPSASVQALSSSLAELSALLASMTSTPLSPLGPFLPILDRLMQDVRDVLGTPAWGREGRRTLGKEEAKVALGVVQRWGRTGVASAGGSDRKGKGRETDKDQDDGWVREVRDLVAQRPPPTFLLRPYSHPTSVLLTALEFLLLPFTPLPRITLAGLGLTSDALDDWEVLRRADEVLAWYLGFGEEGPLKVGQRQGLDQRGREAEQGEERTTRWRVKARSLLDGVRSLDLSRNKLSILDNAIDEAAGALMQYFGIEELGDPSVQSQEDILCVGRICPESDGLKLTPSTTHLESSRMLGSGARVLLRFEDDMRVRGAPPGSGGVGFFPGMLVGFKGRNGGGKVFGVSEVLMMPPIDASYTRPSELLAAQYGTTRQLGGAPLAVIVAAGPYTLDADLEYAPLQALMEVVAREQPDLLILLGPFIDADHPLLRTGATDLSPAQLFKQHISARLAPLAGGRTTAILVPSGRDLTSQHVAFPQAPLARDRELGLPKGVKLLPNPATFSVNEIVFGVSSVDVLFHLRNQELFRKCGEVQEGDPVEEDPSAKDMMARTCRHLLRQKSYYPIFPAPLPSKGIDALNLDITHNDLVKMGSAGADVLILPSLLKHFTKIVDSTIMLNPSLLTRGNAPGTFARLTVHPMPKAELERRVAAPSATGGMGEGEADEAIEHRVWERCRVDVVKI